MRTLLSEDEILNRVKSDWTKPLVTFLCITYNQEDYIEQTIVGFLEQKTSFPYEILIHDDKSTDDTKNIIERYRIKYPNIIRCIYQEENKYSQGLSPIVIAGKECKADYVALCEGDDYWINENKIENQFKLMMSDESISMVVSPGKLERNGKMLSNLHCYYGPENKSITAQDILNVTGQFAPTASYLLKTEFLVKSRELFIKAPVGDLFIELYCAVYGKVVYFPEVGSVYRVSAKGSWSENMASNLINNQVKFISSMEKAIENSKGVQGFEFLDWSRKLAAMYYTLSIYYIKSKMFNDFKNAIIKSHAYAVVAKQQNFLFLFKDFMPFIYEFSRLMSFLRNKLKSVFGRF